MKKGKEGEVKNAWNFPENTGGEFDGFKDAGIEYFAGNPYSAIAREVIQNSVDAPRVEPVKVYFDLMNIAISEFPDIAGLRARVKAAYKQATELKEEDSAAFFAKASEILKKRVLCLRIADSNTQGLRGPCELGKPFFAYMKARGQSVKSTDTAGGSYGIGKSAPFALSDIRTIFVSTHYVEEGKPIDFAQGKAILMSHSGGDGKILKGTGYFGLSNGCMPISTTSAIPEWMQRGTQFSKGVEREGTTVFVAGFRNRKNWQKLLMASVISNYFHAIHEKALWVSFDGGAMEVSSKNLKERFADESIRDAAIEEDFGDQFDLARQMNRCLHEQKAVEEVSQLPRLGQCRIRILVEEGLPKRVGILRNGMLVTRRLRKLVQFPGYSDFIAIVDCLDPKGNKLLRQMENPEHNNFEPDR